jgi:hypothetical protein
LLHGSVQAARAQNRTYVSGTGVDSSGGEIYVLNSADYGPVTINKSIIITSEGAVAGVLATSGTAIIISAGPGDAINLRGLDIDGGSSSSYGIQFNSGLSLSVQKSLIRNFNQSGINFAPSGTSSLLVLDCTVTQNAKNGILLSNSATATLSRVTAFANGVGIFAAGSSISATLADVVTSNNNYGIGASAAALMVQNAKVSNNLIGIAADAGAIMRIGGSTITGNGTGLQATSGGQIQSYATNNVFGNTTDGTPSTTLSLQ